jgi:hypothetical protein
MNLPEDRSSRAGASRRSPHEFEFVLVDTPRLADTIVSLGVSEISSRRRGAKTKRRLDLLFKTERSRFFAVNRA